MQGEERRSSPMRPQTPWTHKRYRAVRRKALMATAMALVASIPAERLFFRIAARALLALMVADGCRKNFLAGRAAAGAYFYLGAVLHILQNFPRGAPADASRKECWLWNIAMDAFFALGFELRGVAPFGDHRTAENAVVAATRSSAISNYMSPAGSLRAKICDFSKHVKSGTPILVDV